MIPSHIEKGYIVFDNTLYLDDKKDLLKTESNMYQSLADTVVSASNKVCTIIYFIYLQLFFRKKKAAKVIYIIN